jgi:Spy/CpxP family protein refolding chaperone
MTGTPAKNQQQENLRKPALGWKNFGRFLESKTEEVQLMRKQLFTLALGGLLTLGVSGAGMAQDNAATDAAAGQEQGRGPGRMNPDRQLEHMTHELGLSADQQNQIRPLLVDRQQKMEAVFQDQSIAQQDRRARLQSIRQESQSKIEAVLNDQQKQKFAAMQQERGRHGGPGGGPQESAPQSQL